jgi:hypothetical protein
MLVETYTYENASSLNAVQKSGDTYPQLCRRAPHRG